MPLNAELTILLMIWLAILLLRSNQSCTQPMFGRLLVPIHNC